MNNVLLHNILRESDYTLSMVITGGGTDAIGGLLKLGGASKYFISAFVPYHMNETINLLQGVPPKSYVSKQCAQDLAHADFVKHGEFYKNHISVACSAKLASTNDRPNREYKACISICIGIEGLTPVYANTEIMYFGNNRQEQEEKLVKDIYTFVFNSIMRWRYRCPVYLVDKTALDAIIEPNPVIYSGSFHPMHHKHLEIARLSDKAVGKKCWLEISYTNFDKPPVDNLLARLDSIDKLYDKTFNGVLITNCPYFQHKVEHFNGDVKFLVGADTLQRIADSTPEILDTTEFIVFHRVGVDIKEKRFPPTVFFMEKHIYQDDGTSSTKLRGAT